jgi:integrase
MLQPDQALELIERLRGHPLHMLASLALTSGMRRNEMLALRWQDVDLDAGRLTIERSLEQTRTHGIRIKSPKTKKGRRSIMLPHATVSELRGHWRAQQEQRLELGIGKAPADSPVLATFDGGPQSPTAVTKRWTYAMAALGMPGVTLHSLRHTHASMLIASISRRLGHSSPTITLNTYGHLVVGTDDKAAQVMNAAFGAALNGSKGVAGSAKDAGLSR